VTSKAGRKTVERVAADSNVVLSAVIGKAALRVFTESSLEVVTTSNVLQEVREYLPRMAKLYELAPEILEGQLRLLAIREHPREDYEHQLEEAERRVGGRDPDDVELLALSLALNIPVWSNDSDFEDSGVEWYTTAKLLKMLGV
jgi:predicted nucleic acid-binding protein